MAQIACGRHIITSRRRAGLGGRGVSPEPYLLGELEAKTLLISWPHRVATPGGDAACSGETPRPPSPARRPRSDAPGRYAPPGYLRNASVAFVPPNPKALLSATSTSCFRAWFGT